jgi:hypothetical protein
MLAPFPETFRSKLARMSLPPPPSRGQTPAHQALTPFLPQFFYHKLELDDSRFSVPLSATRRQNLPDMQNRFSHPQPPQKQFLINHSFGKKLLDSIRLFT